MASSLALHADREMHPQMYTTSQPQYIGTSTTLFPFSLLVTQHEHTYTQPLQADTWTLTYTLLALSPLIAEEESLLPRAEGGYGEGWKRYSTLSPTCTYRIGLIEGNYCKIIGSPQRSPLDVHTQSPSLQNTKTLTTSTLWNSYLVNCLRHLLYWRTRLRSRCSSTQSQT